MSQQIAILGLGTMGIGMAKNLCNAGFTVSAWNRTRSRAEPLAALGARIHDTPAEAAAGCDVVFAMVADDDASHEVWLGPSGALAAMSAGAIAVESSTVTPAWIATLGEAAEAQKVHLLDAPVTGSKPQAEAGQLSFLVGGPPDIVERVRPALDAMGQAVHHLGALGSGARLKLINNFLCGAQLASLAEAMVWMERSGLDRAQALEFLKKAAPGSPLLAGVSARMVQATYEVNFLLPLMAKDMQYAAADAATLNLELKTVGPVQSRLQDAIAAGLTAKDMSAIVEPIRAGKSSSH